MSKPITIREFYARDGSEFSNKDARIVGPVIQALNEEGAVTARDVVDAARSTNSPLHPYFEWNDKVAADQHRLYQARNMLRAIRVKYSDGTDEHIVRAFHVQHAETGGYRSPAEGRQYRSFTVLHGETAFAAQMMQSAIDDLRSWKRKYEPYEPVWANFSEAFAGVINQIGECEGEITEGNLPGLTDEAVAALLEWKERFTHAHAMWDAWRDQLRYIMDAIADAEKVFCGGDPVRHRDCMRCGKSFLSFDEGNRVCKSCASLKGAAHGGQMFSGEMA